MSNSKPTVFDWHRQGIWMVVTPDDVDLFETIADTPWSARATFLRHANRPWSTCEDGGYYVQEFARAES